MYSEMLLMNQKEEFKRWYMSIDVDKIKENKTNVCTLECIQNIV